MERLAPLLGKTLVLVAHPDDEAAGCGVLLQRIRQPVVVFATDGAPRDSFFWNKFGSREAYVQIRRDEALQALALLGIADLHGRFPAQLSGGEQQRVAVARAIVKQPALLLCDEPTGALDCKTGVRVLEALDRVNRQFATPTVLVTHNAVIADMADRVAHLADGMIVRLQSNAARAPPQGLSW